MLGDHDFSCGDQPPCRRASWLHQRLPVAPLSLRLVPRVAGYQSRCFGGADGFALVAIGGAPGKKLEDRFLKLRIRRNRLLPPACLAAEFGDVPVPCPLRAKGKDTAACLANLLFARGYA